MSLPRLIVLEEHWLFADAEYSQESLALFSPIVSEHLREIGPIRKKIMDSNGLGMQIISHIPYDAKPNTIRASNNVLAKSIHGEPDRYRAFALCSMADPKAATAELEHAVKDLGFVGALIGAHTEDGVFFDSEDYLPFWTKAVELDVPIYLHPANPSPSMLKLFEGPYSGLAQRSMATFGWNWHSMTAISLLRLYAVGLFERLPTLKIIVGHMGEFIPFVLDRVSMFAGRWPDVHQYKRSFKQVWGKYIWVTTAGVFSVHSMACLLATTKIDRIVYGVDYPMCSSAEGKKTLEDLRDNDIVDETGLRMIAYENAERLLRLI